MRVGYCLGHLVALDLAESRVVGPEHNQIGVIGKGDQTGAGADYRSETPAASCRRISPDGLAGLSVDAEEVIAV